MAAYSAIIWAAGCFNLTEKLGGKSVISHSIDPFDEDEACLEVLLLADSATRDWIKGDPLTFASAKLRILPAEGTGLSSLPGTVAAARGELVLLNDASRPNFGELAQAVLKQAGKGHGCAPYLQLDMLGAPVQLTAGAEPEPLAAENFFGPAKQAPMCTVAAAVALDGLALVQTPQAYPRAELLAALKAETQLAQRHPGDYAAIYLAQGGQLKAVPGLTGNLNLVNEDAQRLLLKLMGGPARKQKDRYGGLGW
jgi:2-C-methyl-D-erythritol 4-phosphate cytidylyltransferase